MENLTQQQIEELIQFIDDAENPATITNTIVAAVLAFLAAKIAGTATAQALLDEIAARQIADSNLSTSIDQLQQLIQSMGFVVYLDSMGELDGDVDVHVDTGMVVYDPGNDIIKKYASPSQYESVSCDAKLLYCNKVTGYFYRHTTRSGMVQVGLDVVNDLITGGIDKALSAEMGKELAEMIEGSTGGMSASFVGSKLVITGSAAPVPQVNVGALSNNAIACRAGQTAIATFQVSGKRLEGSINIALSNSTKFSLSATSLTPNNGTVPLTTITVTYTPGANTAVGTSHSTDITVTYDSETVETLSLTGAVVAAPSITLTPASLTISAESGQQGSGTIHVQGTALEDKVTLGLRDTSYMSFDQSLSVRSIEVSRNEALTGVDVPVYYTGTRLDTGAITASSTGATDATATVTGQIIQRKAEGETIVKGNLTYTVLADTTKVSVKATSPSTLTGDVVVPSSVEDSGVNYEVASIPADGFKGAEINSISLPDTLKDIGGSAFFGCGKLTSADLGDGLESISGNTAFFGTKLVNVVIPDVFRASANAPFQSISTLKSVQLGKTTAFSPTSIGNILTWAGSTTDDANDNSLDLVICYAATPPNLNNYPRGIAGAVLKVPSGSVSAYQAANYWNKFGSIEAI